MLKPVKQLKFLIDTQYEQKISKYRYFKFMFKISRFWNTFYRYPIMNNIQILFIHRLQQSYKFWKKKNFPYKSSFIPYCKNHLNVYVHMYIRIKIIWGKNKKIKIERTLLDIPLYKRVFSSKLKTFSRGPAASYVYMLSLVWTRYFHIIVVFLLNW